MTAAMDVVLDGLEGRDRLAAADRRFRQMRILARAENSRVRLLIPADDANGDIPELAKSFGFATAGAVGACRSISDEWRSRGLKVSVVIACHNYGHYLGEAVESVLAQTYLPDEILLSDDASSDNSQELMFRFAERNPGLVKVNVNKENMGIDRHFNKAISLTTGDVVMFLGADNRVPPHYVESCLTVLATDPKMAIAYTDFALFGSRANAVHESLRDSFRGRKLNYGVWLSNFPDFNDESREVLDSGLNFIHGSSMYRRAAFDAVGGYGSRSDGPEDMRLFHSMITSGWNARKVPGVYLEYRQHSTDQANMQFSLYRELHALRREVDFLKKDNDLLQQDNERLRFFVDRVRGSIPFRVLRFLSWPYRHFKRRT